MYKIFIMYMYKKLKASGQRKKKRKIFKQIELPL